MSIEQLRDLRRSGHRPATVTVIIGKPHKSTEDGPDKVVINRADADLSALQGLPVHVIDLQRNPAHTLAVLEALERVSVRHLGICGPAGACGSSPKHERAMVRYRESLCPTT